MRRVRDLTKPAPLTFHEWFLGFGALIGYGWLLYETVRLLLWLVFGL